MTRAFRSVETLISSLKYWIAAGGNSAHNELVQAAETLQAQQAELRQWKSVFGHLGTADECGNEWISLKDEIARLREVLEFAAQHKSSDWPERCQQIVDKSRKVLREKL